MLRTLKIESIIDFGRYGFTGLSIETICLMVNSKKKLDKTFIHNMKYNFRIVQDQDYITTDKYPNFIIYQDAVFDEVANTLQFNVLTVFRDRQITKKNTTLDAYGVGQRSVLRSKTAAERSERPPVYYKKVVILL